MKKTLFSIFLVTILVFATFSLSYASDFLHEVGSGEVSNSDMTKISQKIVGTLKTVAIVVAVAILLFVGIKFMLAAPSEKANLKGALIPYLVGAVLIFAAVPIISIIQNITQG